MTISFPYRPSGKVYFGQIYKPFAKTVIKSPSTNKWIEVWMVVDTGADFTVLPKYLAEDLNISLENDCIQNFASGVGGKQPIYLCKNKFTIKIGNMRRTVPLAFINSNQIPPILGRLGFLETFNVKFLKTRAVTFSS